MLFAISGIDFAHNHATLVIEVIHFPRLALFIDLGTFDLFGVPEETFRTSRHLTSSIRPLKIRIFSTALTRIILRNIGVIHLTFIYTLLCAEVVCLPDLALLGQRRTLQKVRIPLRVTTAWSYHTLSSGWVQVRSLFRTLTTISSFNILHIWFTFINTLSFSKIIHLRNITFLGHICALQEERVPF